MDESNDLKPHPHVETLSKAAKEDAKGSPGAEAKEGLSIWFFCGILTLGYGIVLVVTGLCERYDLLGMKQPDTVLANLQPTLWWGLFLLLFGLFYTVKFRPGKG